jgi:hypothetical protein
VAISSKTTQAVYRRIAIAALPDQLVDVVGARPERDVLLVRVFDGKGRRSIRAILERNGAISIVKAQQ